MPPPPGDAEDRKADGTPPYDDDNGQLAAAAKLAWKPEDEKK
jgi:hypothetical protein